MSPFLSPFPPARIGAPISTTHALAGSLLGAAFAAPESAVNWAKVGQQIFLPLGVGPIVAILAAVILYSILTRVRGALGIARETLHLRGQRMDCAGLRRGCAGRDQGGGREPGGVRALRRQPGRGLRAKAD